MGYLIGKGEDAAFWAKLRQDYDIYAPKRFPKQGRFSDTDIIRYDRVESGAEIVFDEKSDYPAKEVLTPICQAILYFTEDEYRASKASQRPILLFMRPCDIHAMQHQEKIYLENGGVADLYYRRMRERVHIVLMECSEGWDTCFCVSMGTNRVEDYALAVRQTEQGLLFDVREDALKTYFAGQPAADFQPVFVEKNSVSVTVPEIADKELLLKLKEHPFWQQFNGRCESCGACTIACSTCTCFTTRDVIYGDNPAVGERRRVTSSCQVSGFDDMAGGISFRKDAASRMRYKMLHKFRDYKARFGDHHMCVGCGRCTDRCPQFISVTATLEKMAAAVTELSSASK